jgi:hypothetical protein
MMRKFILIVVFSSSLFNQTLFAAVTGHPEFETVFLRHVKTHASPAEKVIVYTRSTTSFPCFVARVGLMSCDLTKLNQGAIIANLGQFSDIPLFGGLTYEFPWRIRKVATFAVNVDFNYLYPQDLKYSNLQEASLNGFSGSVGIGKDLLPGYRWIDLIIGIGLEFGRLRVNYSDYGHSIPDQISTKPFLCPKIQIYPKYIFDYFVIGLRGSYRLDLLGSDWTGQSGVSNLGAASATGWTVEAVIGVQLGIYN